MFYLDNRKLLLHQQIAMYPVIVSLWNSMADTRHPMGSIIYAYDIYWAFASKNIFYARIDRLKLMKKISIIVSSDDS